MSRLHVHIAVDDLDQNIRFYSALFGADPGVVKDDYAKWDLTDPAVNFAISARAHKAGLDHVGIQADSTEELKALQARLDATGIAGREQSGTACCYARSDKYWSLDPQGIAWEAFHTLDSIPTFNESEKEAPAQGCCVPEIGASSCCP
ncbi:MAG: ArsI/CadI family heavy metal resistance metalloenzyme [Gammaproteobacteria bacterium]|nr:MAG: ArsI/CadI family heavy metal resistance metalloenzyme [Gammaproteobacteria bacterium]